MYTTHITNLYTVLSMINTFLIKCNRPYCFSCKQWYQLKVHAYFLWKNTWKCIQFHFQITVTDQNCVPKCKVFPLYFEVNWKLYCTQFLFCPAQLSWLDFTTLYQPWRCVTLSLLCWCESKWCVPGLVHKPSPSGFQCTL